MTLPESEVCSIQRIVGMSKQQRATAEPQMTMQPCVIAQLNSRKSDFESAAVDPGNVQKGQAPQIAGENGASTRTVDELRAHLRLPLSLRVLDAITHQHEAQLREQPKLRPDAVRLLHASSTA